MINKMIIWAHECCILMMKVVTLKTWRRQKQHPLGDSSLHTTWWHRREGAIIWIRAPCWWWHRYNYGMGHSVLCLDFRFWISYLSFSFLFISWTVCVDRLISSVTTVCVTVWPVRFNQKFNTLSGRYMIHHRDIIKYPASALCPRAVGTTREGAVLVL